MNLSSRFNEVLHIIRESTKPGTPFSDACRKLSEIAPVQPASTEQVEHPYANLFPAQRAFRKARLAKADEIAQALKAKGR